MSDARRWPRAALWITGWLLAASLPAVAPRAEEPPPAEPEKQQEQAAATPAGTASETGTVEEALTPEERRAKAKAARIEEYLRKRDARLKQADERRAASVAEGREAEAQAIERELATAEGTADEPAETAPHPAAAAAVAVPVVGKAAKARQPSSLPRGLAKAQANVRATELGADPTVKEYLALIDEQGASPHQLAAFGNFVAENGLIRDALEYYEVALRIEPNDPVLWINFGTLHVQAGSPSAAAKAFGHALTLNPNSAVAHYNLGAALDSMDHYEDALLEYKAALTIDPTLGDPTHNPQAANNEHLTTVKLMLHQEHAGSLNMGLIEVPTGDEAPPAAGNSPD